MKTFLTNLYKYFYFYSVRQNIVGFDFKTLSFKLKAFDKNEFYKREYNSGDSLGGGTRIFLFMLFLIGNIYFLSSILFNFELQLLPNSPSIKAGVFLLGIILVFSFDFLFLKLIKVEKLNYFLPENRLSKKQIKNTLLIYRLNIALFFILGILCFIQ